MAMTPAEKQAAYRSRQKEKLELLTASRPEVTKHQRQLEKRIKALEGAIEQIAKTAGDALQGRK
jgi:hypothetical protein